MIVLGIQWNTAADYCRRKGFLFEITIMNVAFKVEYLGKVEIYSYRSAMREKMLSSFERIKNLILDFK